MVGTVLRKIYIASHCSIYRRQMEPAHKSSQPLPHLLTSSKPHQQPHIPPNRSGLHIPMYTPLSSTSTPQTSHHCKSSSSSSRRCLHSNSKSKTNSSSSRQCCTTTTNSRAAAGNACTSTSSWARQNTEAQWCITQTQDQSDSIDGSFGNTGEKCAFNLCCFGKRFFGLIFCTCLLSPAFFVDRPGSHTRTFSYTQAMKQEGDGEDLGDVVLDGGLDRTQVC